MEKLLAGEGQGSEEAGMISCWYTGWRNAADREGKVGALKWSGIVRVNLAPAAPALLEGSPPKEKESLLPGREIRLFCN